MISDIRHADWPISILSLDQGVYQIYQIYQIIMCVLVSPVVAQRKRGDYNGLPAPAVRMWEITTKRIVTEQMSFPDRSILKENWLGSIPTKNDVL